MLKVTVGKQLKPASKEETNVPFKAKGTIETERTSGEATVVVQAIGNGQVQLVVDARQKSTIGRHVVGQYVDSENKQPAAYVASISPVPAPTADDPTATTPGVLAEGVELVFDAPVIVVAAKEKAQEQQVF